MYSKKSSSPNIFSGLNSTKQPVTRPPSSGSSRGGEGDNSASAKMPAGTSNTTKTKDSIDSSRKSSEESTAAANSQNIPPSRFGRFNMFARKTTKKKSKDSSIKETKLKLFLKRTSEPLLDTFTVFNPKKVRENILVISSFFP